MSSVFQQFKEHLIDRGIDPKDMDGMEEQDENSEKQAHLDSIQNSIEDFSRIISQKDFVLLAAPKGRRFYLGDNPVALMNENPVKGFGSNIGLTVKGIQIYVPLTSKLTLAAWCPSILEEIKESAKKSKKDREHLIAKKTLGTVNLTDRQQIEFDQLLLDLAASSEKVEKFTASADAGEPIPLTDDNMDRYNSLQVQSAKDFIVCQKGDFSLARKIVAKEGPEGGIRFRVG